ncbi:YbaB/EbfC family nucleoid-associated protein [Kribbella sp. NPDC051586]|uniref:YbaB/EbfC family nucleoid-associated protein n=1 Tax=Kribbella sp. NPDC051586 TaxID=3364118 RepID=UPI0037AD1F74
MFDGGGAGGFDMSNLLAQAQAMQSQLMEAQADLEGQEIEGSAGGGLVTALVSGTGELLSLNIKKEAVDPDDTETLADLVVAAVRDASENAKQAAAAAMGPLAGGLGGAFGGEGGFPGFGGGAPAQSAPAGFGLPGATPPAVGPGDDDAPGSASEPDEPRPGGQASGSQASGSQASGSQAGDAPAGETRQGDLSQADGSQADGGQADNSGRAADENRGGVGFVNPGSGAGASGQNPG